jgi:hypothetical protein
MGNKTSVNNHTIHLRRSPLDPGTGFIEGRQINENGYKSHLVAFESCMTIDPKTGDYFRDGYQIMCSHSEWPRFKWASRLEPWSNSNPMRLHFPNHVEVTVGKRTVYGREIIIGMDGTLIGDGRSPPFVEY